MYPFIQEWCRDERTFYIWSCLRPKCSIPLNTNHGHPFTMSRKVIYLYPSIYIYIEREKYLQWANSSTDIPYEEEMHDDDGGPFAQLSPEAAVIVIPSFRFLLPAIVVAVFGITTGGVTSAFVPGDVACNTTCSSKRSCSILFFLPSFWHTYCRNRCRSIAWPKTRNSRNWATVRSSRTIINIRAPPWWGRIVVAALSRNCFSWWWRWISWRRSSSAFHLGFGSNTILIAEDNDDEDDDDRGFSCIFSGWLRWWLSRLVS